jgi:hypothetical protein
MAGQWWHASEELLTAYRREPIHATHTGLRPCVHATDDSRRVLDRQCSALSGSIELIHRSFLPPEQQQEYAAIIAAKVL